MTEPSPAGLYRRIPFSEYANYKKRGWKLAKSEWDHHTEYGMLMFLPGATEEDEIVEALVG